MKIIIPLYQPSLLGNEKKYVTDCLDSNWISSKGKYIKLFQDEFAKKNKINFALSVCNGTVAIHLALMSLDIGPGDEVIVPTLTFIASVNPIFYTGAKPVFVDSDKDSWQIDPFEVEKKITAKTKAIIVVHLYGQPSNMELIMKIAKKYNLYVIEDCAEALGSRFKNKPVGTFGDISTFSFFGNKTITTGEGGMVATNNINIFKKCLHLKSQGLNQTDKKEYWHDIVGYNYRMTNICSAIGLAQLERLDEFIEKKRILYELYKKELKDLPIKMHEESVDSFSTFWLINILVEKSDVKENLRDYLTLNGIETRPIFTPIHKMPMYRKNSYNFPISDDLSSRGISLPSWPDMPHNNVVKICNKIKKFIK